MVYLSGSMSAQSSMASNPLAAHVYNTTVTQPCILLGTVYPLITKMTSEHTKQKTQPQCVKHKNPQRDKP
jgi:hypothetical protein